VINQLKYARDTRPPRRGVVVPFAYVGGLPGDTLNTGTTWTTQASPGCSTSTATCKAPALSALSPPPTSACTRRGAPPQRRCPPRNRTRRAPRTRRSRSRRPPVRPRPHQVLGRPGLVLGPHPAHPDAADSTTVRFRSLDGRDREIAVPRFTFTEPITTLAGAAS
jgi:hypothetical protein